MLARVGKGVRCREGLEWEGEYRLEVSLHDVQKSLIVIRGLKTAKNVKMERSGVSYIFLGGLRGKGCKSDGRGIL